MIRSHASDGLPDGISVLAISVMRRTYGSPDAVRIARHGHLQWMARSG
jgi:hypothetical protein